MKRIQTWNELDPRLRAAAIAMLRRLALEKARYDGTLTCYAWPERIAPLLRYTLTSRGTEVWDCDVMQAARARGDSLWTLPVLEREGVAA